MKILLKFYHHLSYKLFGWHREKVILCRGVVPIILLEKMYEEVKAKNLNIEIEELQKRVDDMLKEDAKTSDDIKAFQRSVDNETYDLMLKLIELKKRLAPEEEKVWEDLKKHYEKVKNATPDIIKPKKKPKNLDKKLKALYRKPVNIYHPDKAPKGKEEAYAEIFRTITVFRDNGDYKGLKAYAKTLKKFAKKKGINLKKLIKLKDDLLKRVKKIKEERLEFYKSKVWGEFKQYKDNPNRYIKTKRQEMLSAIKNLEDEIYLRERSQTKR